MDFGLKGSTVNILFMNHICLRCKQLYMYITLAQILKVKVTQWAGHGHVYVYQPCPCRHVYFVCLFSLLQSKSSRVNPYHSRANDSPRDSLYASALLEPPLLDIDSEGGEGEGEREGRRGGNERGEDHGLAVVELSTLHFYLVSGYRGDQNHDYICASVSIYQQCVCALALSCVPNVLCVCELILISLTPFNLWVLVLTVCICFTHKIAYNLHVHVYLFVGLLFQQQSEICSSCVG